MKIVIISEKMIYDTLKEEYTREKTIRIRMEKSHAEKIISEALGELNK